MSFINLFCNAYNILFRWKKCNSVTQLEGREEMEVRVSEIGIVIPFKYDAERCAYYFQRLLITQLWDPRITMLPSELLFTISHYPEALQTTGTPCPNYILQMANPLNRTFPKNIKVRAFCTSDTFPLGPNRNLGTSLLNRQVSKYVSFFDADDITHPSRVHILQELFDEYKAGTHFFLGGNRHTVPRARVRSTHAPYL